MVRALAIDVGTSSVRTGVVEPSGALTHTHQRRLTIHTPNPGEVELDASEIARLTLECARQTLSDAGPCDVVGITNQRATTVVFDPLSGQPVGPALGWQDLRTVIDCLVLQSEGLRLAPNQSATKARWLVAQSGRRARDLRFATIETWIAWHLSEGALHVSDRSNAGVNGLVNVGVDGWDEHVLSVLELDRAMFPDLVDTMGSYGRATALSGAPLITALVGDQPASLFGQSCVRRGTKITFGTGAMLESVRGPEGPTSMTRFESGCFPVVVRSRDGDATWGVEGIVLSAGACVDWLVQDLRLIGSASESSDLASGVPTSDGVSFVPALSGIGTPLWDFGARGGFFGLTRGATTRHLVRAVLEGVAQRGVDLIDAAQRETGQHVDEVRVDGGMSDNEFFVQCLADFSGIRVAISDEREATTRGCGLMALVSAEALSLDDVEDLWSPVRRYEPTLSADHRLDLRAEWSRTLNRAARTIPELSDVTF